MYANFYQMNYTELKLCRNYTDFQKNPKPDFLLTVFP